MRITFVLLGCVRLFLLVFLGSAGEKPLSAQQTESVEPAYTNRLAKERSPYLLQHAHNPVDWYSWGEEAFARARRESKPIFLSVGYSTCHWCHVMERESFENPEVAKVMNEGFVCIKVDREERPDVDRVYMTFVQASTGGGGWPMSVWLTPELKPFFGGTYFPPETFTKLLKQISGSWKTDREKIVTQGDRFTRALQEHIAAQEGKTNALEQTVLQNAFTEMAAAFDSKEGGENGAPKFPRPVTLNFFFRVMAREGKGSERGKQALEMNLLTLKKMASGGIHDHLGGGFHRYSVDGFWHVPHFEKMLYDQAQLAISYLDAFQITRASLYETIARDICKYVRRDMSDPEGGFYSAEDADSLLAKGKPEHGEGAFYVWKKEEIDRVLGEPAAGIFNFYYGVEGKGNVRESSDPRGELRGYNVLIERRSLQEAAKKFKIPEDQIGPVLTTSRQKLFEARARRPRPHLDDKVITAWNGLMISAFSKAYQILGDSVYLESATRAARFLREQLYKPETGELIRSYRKGASNVPGFADDYAFVIQGLLDLYEASFDVQWVSWAVQLQGMQDKIFWERQRGGYYDVSGSDPTILLRMKEDYDGAEPSPNSVSALNLLRLSQITDNAKLRQQAEEMFQTFSGKLKEMPRACPQLLVALDFHFDTPKQIVLAGKNDSLETRAMLREIHRHFIPNKVLLLADGGVNQTFLSEKLEFIKGLQMSEGQTTAYICENYICKLPTANPAKVAQMLGD